MQKHLAGLFLLLFTRLAVFAQQQNVDSLFAVLVTAKEDTNKVNLLRNIGVVYINQDPQKAIE